MTTEATAAQKMKVKEMLVSRLRLKIKPAEIDDAAPLFREGLGLDSIDALEVVAAVEHVFGVVIESEEQGKTALRSVDSLASFLLEKGAAL